MRERAARRTNGARWHGVAGAIAAALTAGAFAQHTPTITEHARWHGASGTEYVVPQGRSFAPAPHIPAIVVERVDANVEIAELSAATTLEITMRNKSGGVEEAQLLIPVPAGSAISSFMFEGTASEPAIEILPKDEARRVYDSIVATVRDPALLEFAGHNLIRSSVFPVQPGATQRVRVTYEHLLESNGETAAYVLPRSQSLEMRSPWSISVDVRGGKPISTVYSPTHEILTERKAANHLAVTLAPQAVIEPGPFRLFVLREQGELSATVMAYPDPTVGGGYFLLAAGLPADVNGRGSTQKRDVTIVLDRSGSMAGEKMRQAQQAIEHVLQSLGEGESFNIIDFGTSVNRFANEPTVVSAEALTKARDYVRKLGANGGTNTFAALHEALRTPPPANTLPLVLFLTDGLPTIGRTTEQDIRALVEKGNPHGKRVYTFGVGHDVNGALLDRLADVTRGAASYVLPEEDVATAVATTLRRLRGPVFTDLSLTVLGDGGGEPVFADLQPTVMPDLYQGDHLVLLGRYTREQPVKLRIAGKYFGAARAFDVSFDLGSSASTRHDFVPRLWATRRIAALIDKVRQAAPAAGVTPGSTSPGEIDAIVQEIVALSTKFGILTEYTAFLAREGTNLGDASALMSACRSNLESRAVNTRWGAEAINQSFNYNAQKAQTVVNYRNEFYDASMERVEFSAVQQVADCALYNRNGQWIDSRLAQQEEQRPTRTVVLGSEEHRKLVDELMAQGRQALLAMPGEVLLLVDGERVLVVNAANPE